ncbi:hypothetical protein AB0G71_01000 [Streptomyces sp. NPDC020403]|uniref:hypothetical protein n=1 Tax=unclassified Streptomyces TaxID=2593676 RepID=UPI0033D46873
MDDLVALPRRRRPDLVVWDTLMMGGSIAAQACGAAHARLLYGLDLVGTMRERHLTSLAARPEELREDPLAEWLEWTAARYGGGFRVRKRPGRSMAGCARCPTGAGCLRRSRSGPAAAGARARAGAPRPAPCRSGSSGPSWSR